MSSEDYHYADYERMGMKIPARTRFEDLYDPRNRPPAASRRWESEMQGLELIEVPGFGAVLFRTQGDDVLVSEFTRDEIKPILHEE